MQSLANLYNYERGKVQNIRALMKSMSITFLYLEQRLFLFYEIMHKKHFTYKLYLLKNNNHNKHYTHIYI